MTHSTFSMIENEDGIIDYHLDENGNFAMAYDAEAISQHATQRLNTFQGEWFLNNDIGLPWTTEILGRFDPEISQAYIKTELIETDGVVSIEGINVSQTSSIRRLNADDIEIKTIYDE